MSVLGIKERGDLRRDISTLQPHEPHPIRPIVILSLLETIDDVLDEPKRSIKEWFHDIADLLDQRWGKLMQRAKYEEQTSAATVPLHEATKRVAAEINNIREEIHSLPGWTGQEPDAVTTLNAVRAERDELRAEVLRLRKVQHEVHVRFQHMVARLEELQKLMEAG